jgi:hypothetical protein
MRRFHRRKRSGFAQKLEIHFTPKHGSWLDIAEVELSALAAQCLGSRRIGDIETLNGESSAWHTQRNYSRRVWIGSSPPPTDARIKLKRLYPEIEKHFKKMDNADTGLGAAVNQFAIIYGEDRVPL